MSVGFVILSLLGLDFYSRLTTPPASLTTQGEVSSSLPQTEADTLESPELTTPPINSPDRASTPKSTQKPTPRPALVSPTPTPRPNPDYFVQSHTQILLPENTLGITEFTQTSTYPRMRLETQFALQNAQLGDKVEYRVYENGTLQSLETRTVASTNAIFVEVYHLKARNIGTHTVRMVYNENKALPESNYSNNEYTFTVKIIGETEPPTFTIDGPYLINGQTCMRWINLVDNVSVYTDVWGKWKIDDEAWSNRTSENPYGCISGISGSEHTYYVHAQDAAGNTRESSQVFTLY